MFELKQRENIYSKKLTVNFLSKTSNRVRARKRKQIDRERESREDEKDIISVSYLLYK